MDGHFGEELGGLNPADSDGVRSRSARVPKHQLNTSATRPENQPEKLGPSRDLSGGSTEESPHASASASKIFFSDLDVIPGLGGEPEEPTVEEQCAQAITNRARDIEKLYKQDCETLGMVVKMLISKDPTLEQKLLTALTQNLVDIREKCLGNLSQFISEVNALLKAK
ncbi:periphilin-1 [Rhinichthys klamathensis goyatoka]|uniref:periphilin-1 n=1 Tax=Rhinichthys klamathensis goyatoka TaxID=3034132 RepID=UPI0024B58369|nr:periphilin-1 [Rhinichthys klamathensis goyatoka]